MYAYQCRSVQTYFKLQSIVREHVWVGKVMLSISLPVFVQNWPTVIARETYPVVWFILQITMKDKIEGLSIFIGSDYTKCPECCFPHTACCVEHIAFMQGGNYL
jgi:hypothetical protein